VGTVTEIHISQDSKSIVVTAQMDSDAEAYLKQQTLFWVVRPQVGLRGVSGLNTLLSGPYIGMKPGLGKWQTHFIGLNVTTVIKKQC
ncbi:MlaD family protein, partial [Methylocucumis oryzae]|uniref:MlaD family protein n=1 Tax=Methylocucumis oryzae TaxID=1632867 RepID=UPI000A848602